jgi:minor curlin subunit
MPAMARFSAVLVALSLSAAAQAKADACPGEVAMTDRGKTTIIRSGAGNTATIVRKDDADGTVRLEQHGENHAALAVQSGTGEKLSISQSGSSGAASVNQNGACNDTELAQAGSGNSARVTQNGNGNRAVVRQGPQREN